MKIPPECQEYKSVPEIVLKEKRSKITFLNPNQDQILVITVDKCVINNNETLRCDYEIILPNKVEIYVELKGSDILRALKQIESTIKLLSNDPQKIKKLCFVVSTRVPRETTSVQQWKSQFKKKFNASLRIKNIEDSYNLIDAKL